MFAAIFLHITLISISIITELIYSSFVNPGKEAAFYRSHAEKPAHGFQAFSVQSWFFLLYDGLLSEAKVGFWFLLFSFRLCIL